MLNEIEKLHNKWLDFYSNHYPSILRIKRPEIKLSDKLTTTAGKTKIKMVPGICVVSSEIIYNTNILNSVPIQNFENTIAHEISHFVATAVYRKNCGHDNNWRKIFALSGFPVDRCHNYQIEKRINSHYKFNCPCGASLKITPYFRDAIINFRKICNCPKCKKIILPSDVINLTLIKASYVPINRQK